MQEQFLQTIKTAYGHFTVDMERDKKIGTSLVRGHHQQETLRFLKTCISKETTVVDIGAHIGTLAVPCALWSKQVIAFEPSAESFALLQKNAKQNNVAIDARNIGLSSSIGHASLIGKNATNAGAQTLEVGEGTIPLSTLDDEVSHADVIKIDVEGMELEVLQGGERLLEKSHPMIVLEVNLSQLRSHGTSPKALATFLSKHRYALYMLMDTKGGLMLGKVGSLSLLSACIAPRAWLMHTESAPFDIVALPKEKPPTLSTTGFGSVLVKTVAENIKQKLRRLRAYIGI